jgi:hypothetical protein
MIFRDEMRANACNEKDFGNGIKSPKSRSYFVDVGFAVAGLKAA